MEHTTPSHTSHELELDARLSIKSLALISKITNLSNMEVRLSLSRVLKLRQVLLCTLTICSSELVSQSDWD